MCRNKWIGIALLCLFVGSCFLLYPQIVRHSGVEAWEYYRLHFLVTGDAFHTYHKIQDEFPAPAIRNNEGLALLSWRVDLLPFIEQDGIYRKMKHDEPWDSPHNMAFIEKRPRHYDPWGLKENVGLTHFQAVTGRGTAFENDRVTLADFPDGTATTIMVVEAGIPVPWTKPEDWVYDPQKPLPPLGYGFTKAIKFLGYEWDRKQGFNALFADGSVRFLWQDTDEKVLRALFTRNGGEAINLDDLP